MQLLRDDAHDLVLEPLLVRVGEGEIIGVGADPEHARFGGGGECKQGESGKAHHGTDTTPHGLPPSLTGSSTLPVFKSMTLIVPSSPSAV
jgi:hypothetical protein